MKLRMFYEEHGQKSTVWSGKNGFSPRKKKLKTVFFTLTYLNMLHLREISAKHHLGFNKVVSL